MSRCFCFHRRLLAFLFGYMAGNARFETIHYDCVNAVNTSGSFQNDILYYPTYGGYWVANNKPQFRYAHLIVVQCAMSTVQTRGML